MVFRRSKRSSKNKIPDISVEIYDTVMERIFYAISRSNTEEGGKLIGTITQSKSKVKMQIETYIDSGPNVSNSASHLHPNGEYQEAMFRVIERFRPTIEHLGSWHSHHCNGLNDLSEGDIGGYTRSVNNLHYNLNYFFVILVTGIEQKGIRSRYFIFQRGQKGFSELSESTVHITRGSCSLDSILKQAESASFDARGLSDFRENTHPISHETYRYPTSEEFLQQMRAEDQQWLNRKYSRVQAFQNSKDGAVFWQWLFQTNQGPYYFRYYHPTNVIEPAIAVVKVEVSYQNHPIYCEEFPIDQHRLESVERFVGNVEQRIISSHLPPRSAPE